MIYIDFKNIDMMGVADSGGSGGGGPSYFLKKKKKGF